MTMECVAPKMVNEEIKIEVEAADIEFEVKFWESSLIMYALGGNLSMNVFKQYMMKF